MQETQSFCEAHRGYWAAASGRGSDALAIDFGEFGAYHFPNLII